MDATTTLAKRMARLEQTNISDPERQWGEKRLQTALGNAETGVREYLAAQSDVTLVRIMFTPRQDVTLSELEVAVTDSLTMNLLDLD